jgi:hypothetical protein
VSIYENISGEMIGCNTGWIEAEFGSSIVNVSPNNPGLIAARKKCRDKFFAIAFIEHADKSDMRIYKPA